MNSKQHILSKRAQISPVFKYIFVLVIGAIILIFFLRFAFFTEKGGQQLIKAEALHTLDSSLQAFSVSGYSSGAMPTPPWPQLVQLKFGTEANCGKLTIEGQKYSKILERIIFSPEEIKTKQLQAWTMSWSFPFRITNFFFLLNPQRSKYYLLYDSGEESFIKSLSSNPPATSDMEHLPSNFKAKPITSTSTEPDLMLGSSDLVKVNHFVESGTGSCPVSIQAELKGSCIEYSSACKQDLALDELYKCYGTVTFYEEGTQTGTLPFIGREMMFGAIMADTYEIYKCQYEKALEELERIVNLYLAKTEKLRIKKPDCGDKYVTGAYPSSIKTLLDKIKTSISEIKNSQTYDKAEQLSNDASNVKEFNQNEIAGDVDCEMVF